MMPFLPEQRAVTDIESAPARLVMPTAADVRIELTALASLAARNSSGTALL